MNARRVDTAKQLADGDFDHALENAIEFGMIEGIEAERGRIAGIMRSPEARHCQATALMLALHDSRLSVECVRDIPEGGPGGRTRSHQRRRRRSPPNSFDTDRGRKVKYGNFPKNGH